MQKELDLKWKFFCLELAQKEFLEREGDVEELERLFDRAREYYSEGIKCRFFDWKSIWDTDDNKEEEKVKVELSKNEGFKICPTCGEDVPVKHEIHFKKKDGTRCGHKF
jgi:hypothetical protein